MKIKVRDVRPNPYRNIDHYPLNKEKIMALTSSIEKTGFWDNLVAREVNGEVQIAYGHHRIEALRLAKGYGYDFEFELPIKDIDDGTMIQIMANENMQEWGHSIVVTDETVKVAKKFLELQDRFGSSKLTHKHTASAKDIADFLGWNQSKVSSSLKRMDLIESGKVTKEAVESLPSETHAVEFAKAISKATTDFTPKEQEVIAKKISDGGHGKRDVKGIIEAADFEKNFTKKDKKKSDPRILKFEHHLLHVSHELSSATDSIIKLSSMHQEIKMIYSKKGADNVSILFATIGKHMRKLKEFIEIMSKDEQITKDNINTLKQLQDGITSKN